MGIPLVLLAIGSLFVGYLSKDMIIGLGTPFWGHSLFILTENVTFLEAEYLPYHIKLIPFIFSHIGIFVAYNTTFFLSSLQPSLSSQTASLSNSSLHVVSSGKPSALDGDLAQLSVEKNLLFFNFHTRKEIIKIYTFFNQK